LPPSPAADEVNIEGANDIVFDVAATSKRYERVAVAKNLKYVHEAIRAEGVSPSMLIVWENNDNNVAALHAIGKIEPYPVEF
jgi:hypothetical protein